MRKKGIVLLALSWRFFVWTWSFLILGIIVGVLGNGIYNFFITGSLILATPATLRFLSSTLQFLHHHLYSTSGLLAMFLVITGGSFFANRALSQKKQLEEASKHKAILSGMGEVQQAVEVMGKSLKEMSKVIESRKDPIIPSLNAFTTEAAIPIVHWNVPYRRNPFFTGREDLLILLHERLTLTRTAALTQPQAMSGLGGIGKTQTAVEYAYRFRYEYNLVLWLRAASQETLIADFFEIARILDLPIQEEKDQAQVVVAVKRWLETHEKWLLIFDNADDLNMISDFLPTTDSGHILITTRIQATGELAEPILVEKMNRHEAILLLLRRARLLETNTIPEQASQADQEIAGEIANELGDLPLALDQAGAYIEETKCGLAGYLDLYRSQHKALLQRRGSVPANQLHPEPVTITWSLSFQKIEQSNRSSADLLRLCAFLDPDAIPEEIFIDGAHDLGTNLKSLATNINKLNNTIEEILHYSLLRRDMNTKTLIIHRLVQVVLKDEISPKMQQRWAERVIRAINHTFPEIEVATWFRCQRLISHIQVCAKFITEYEFTFPEVTEVLAKAGYYLVTRAQYKQAEPLLQQALAICKQASRHLHTAQCLHLLGWLYSGEGRFTEAEPLLLEALTIRKQILGSTDPQIAQSLTTLSSLYMEQGRYVEAEPLLQEALAINQQAFGANHLNTSKSFHYLGALYNEQGRFNEAEPMFQKALEISKEVLGQDHPDTIANSIGLGWIYVKSGKYEEAEPLFEKALEIRKKNLGPTHPTTADSIDALAWLYWCQGQDKYHQAELLYKEALDARKQTLEASHPAIAQNLLFLALVYRDQGKYKDAESLCEEAIKIYQQGNGVGSVDIGKAHGVYASLLLRSGKIIKATKTGILALRILGLKVTLRYVKETVRVYTNRIFHKK